MIAQTRVARHQLIADIIQRESVHSQVELLNRLANEGVEVTQATLSRDLGEIGAEKVRHGRRLIYAVPSDGPEREMRSGADGLTNSDSRLRRVLTELLVDAESNGQVVVVHTPPGAANFLASAIDHTALTPVLGTVAGDDTIVIIPRAGHTADDVATLLLALSEGEA
ncbi:arginine repressor [Demetria terragena]|uniref:arginine repressor n=1 Tax=Demetria terragena TaxID=63959 RepID=UPI000373348B|nr:arginine repressor [Demetria terragena]